MFGSGQLRAQVDRLEERVRIQQEVINALCAKVGVDPVAVDPISQVDAAERALIVEGKPIQAIKHHRERTGSSLKQAKDAVDRAAGR